MTTVMTERGYPTGEDEQVLADLSVEHAQTVGHFRAAQDLSRNAATGKAATEDLRQALIHYRELFSDLLGEPAQTTDPSATSDADTEPGHQNGQPVAAAGVAAERDGVAVGSPAPNQSDAATRYGGTS